MGGGRWTTQDWDTYSAKNVSSAHTVKDIFKSTNMDPLLNPHGVAMRESRISVDNPKPTPLIVGLDVTGSMGDVLEAMARRGLKTTAEEVYSRKPISDPHIMFMGIGDVAAGDSAPLQITQFEADIRVAEQLQKIWLEEGGGGNGSESYALAWYFAAMHTGIDSFEREGRKGYLFTIGDDGPTPRLTRVEIERVFGDKVEADLSGQQLLEMVSRMYEVFHLMLTRGRTTATGESQWRALLGERAIKLNDHTKLGEVIVSILQQQAGVDKQTIANSWDGSTGLIVAEALKPLTFAKDSKTGVVRFN